MNLNVLKYKINKRVIWLFGDKKYKNYSDALKDCFSKGYESNVVIDFVMEKAKRHRQMFNASTPNITNLNVLSLLSLINALAARNKTIRVIDFGGGDGGHYLQIRQLISEKITLNWQVVETSDMVKALQPFSTNELSFCDDLDEAIRKGEEIDIIYTAGTLQYTPNPYAFIEKMTQSSADYLIFNRQTLNANPLDLITIQRSLLSWHGSSDVSNVTFTDCEIRYPVTNMSVQKFEDIVQKKYALLYTFDDLSGMIKVRNEKIIGKSYVLKKL